MLELEARLECFEFGVELLGALAGGVIESNGQKETRLEAWEGERPAKKVKVNDRPRKQGLIEEQEKEAIERWSESIVYRGRERECSTICPD